MALIDIDEILTILPHRAPMLLVDKVIECDFKQRIVGVKNLTFNEPFFQGHFPGHPVMPGVLQLEAMAQTAGILMNKLFAKENSIAYFLTVDKAKFRRIVKPGDQLLIEATFLKARLGMSKVHGRITVDGELASEADLMFAYK